MSAMVDACQGKPARPAVEDLAAQLVQLRGEVRAAEAALLPCLDVLVVAAQGWRREIRENEALRGRLAEKGPAATLWADA